MSLFGSTTGTTVALGTGAVLGSFAFVYNGIKTGNPQMDRWAIRGNMVLNSFLLFGPKVLMLDIPRAAMAIIWNESRGADGQLGDQGISFGPSVGPMQVLRATAQELNLSPLADSSSDYAALASDTAWGIKAGLTVLKDKLRLSGGDLLEAIRRYNGSGAAAEAYRDNAINYAADLGWRLGGSGPALGSIALGMTPAFW